MAPRLVVWRHPLPIGAAGRCIGHSDLPVDPRRAKRLAHRVRRRARREGWPRCVWTSALQRGAAVGRWLARWGWRHIVDERLTELDFGAWEGRRWSEIGPAAMEAWCADFAGHAPGGGESVRGLFQRCAGFIQNAPVDAPLLIIGHAGWINAARFIVDNRPAPRLAAEWPPSVAYGEAVELGCLPREGALPSSG